MITPRLLRSLMESESHPVKDAEAVAIHLQAAATRFEINNARRVAHFLAQLAHESGFRAVEENLGYSAERLRALWPQRFTPESAVACERKPERIAEVVYQGRFGNTQPGDGFRFRGRGFIQITGRENYVKYGGTVGHDLVTHPELAAQYEVGALIAAAFWHENHCNALADQGDVEMVKPITLKVNGGINGLAERTRYFVKAKEALAQG